MPDNAASILNPKLDELVEANLGGSIRVKGLAVLRRLRMPTRLRVGDLPAGALRGEALNVVLSFLIGERASRIALRGDTGEAEVVGVRARKKFAGFWKANASLEEPSEALDRFGDKNCRGSMFSESKSSVEEKSNVSALRFEGDFRVEVSAIEGMSIVIDGGWWRGEV